MRPEGGVAESALGTVRMGLDKDLDVLCGQGKPSQQQLGGGAGYHFPSKYGLKPG